MGTSLLRYLELFCNLSNTSHARRTTQTSTEKDIFPQLEGTPIQTPFLASIQRRSCAQVNESKQLLGRTRPPLPQFQWWLLQFQTSFFVASAFRPVWPGRCIWALSVYRSRLAPWTRGESNHGKLSARGPEAKDDTASLQRRLFNFKLPNSAVNNIEIGGRGCETPGQVSFIRTASSCGTRMPYWTVFSKRDWKHCACA